MENRIYNFNPGPAMQPLEVLQEAQAEFLNFAKSGMSIIEISHRSKQYEQVHNQAKADIKELMGLGDDYEVLFCQGGASMQFTMIHRILLLMAKWVTMYYLVVLQLKLMMKQNF